MAAFEGALARGDVGELRRAAHQLKGAAGGYGFGPITAVAGELEQALARGADAAGSAAILARLVAVCARARSCVPAAEAV
jgi:HPt (histidine-containing phosphotransfer) domain-containing protein